MNWRPIDTAPFLPDASGRFYCLLQWRNWEGTPVTGEGYAKWRKDKAVWLHYGSRITPTHWQPLPLPFNEPLNEVKP